MMIHKIRNLPDGNVRLFGLPPGNYIIQFAEIDKQGSDDPNDWIMIFDYIGEAK